jgi:hypothetical protein
LLLTLLLESHTNTGAIFTLTQHVDARTKMALTLLINLWFVCDLCDVNTNAICMQIQLHHACGADNKRGKKEREGRGGKMNLPNFSMHSITKLTVPRFHMDIP